LRLWWVPLMVAACGEPAPAPVPVPASVAPTATETIALSFRPDLLVSLELPDSSRGALGPVPDRWAIPRAFKPQRQRQGRMEFTVKKPFRVVYYGQGRGREGKRVKIHSPIAGKLKHKPFRKARLGPPGTWGMFKKRLVVRTRRGQGPPEGLTVEMPMATEAERDLNLVDSGRTPEDFALRTLPIEHTREHGLFLPAPGIAVFQLKVPANGQLRTVAHLLRPAVDQGHASDGATVSVIIDDGTGPTEVAAAILTPDDTAALTADLSAYAGKDVQLRFVSSPGPNADLDYVFLADPVVTSPNPTPRRLLFVFVDTLRADHLGTYGYDRPTSPAIDGMAAEGTVFEQARAPAPWTLPSALAAVYGRTPEAAAQSTHLGTRLSRAGWASCAVISNVWLTDPSTLASGWSRHWGRPLSPARQQVKQAERCLSAHPDRDVFLFVHMIDPHLPYKEPPRFQGRFAEEPPDGMQARIGKKRAIDAHTAAASPEDKAAIRHYVAARYDQNILAVDEAVGELLALVGPDAISVLSADHGEELLERNGYGHGHSLFDELVRVPLIVRAPGFEPGRVQVPVGLMDIAPTLLELLGLPPLEATETGVRGWSLAGLMRGDTDATTRFSARPLPMGRLLLSDDRWGVVTGHHKWITRDSHEQVFDLTADPLELQDIAASPAATAIPFSDKLAQGLNRPVGRVLRIVGPGRNREMADAGSSMVVSHPAGIVAAWTRIDPRDEYTTPAVVDGTATVPIVVGKKTPRELYVQLPEGTAPTGLTVTRANGTAVVTATVDRLPKRPTDPLLTAGDVSTGFTVTYAWQPLPEAAARIGIEGDITAELRALGYVE
jgi:arylsulfatase A-like enzyme